ncbi:uncharacterized protein LOC124700952 [Lolium rigidum]|uniref:uncharacterized protein LOC124700952 n=1 Tax=Lolium rigidum TaxID=89674 RepID=UPI001F5DCFD0|nr:uncharacterized protein LOC124700952 [Lolium rigidum]
MEFLLYPLGRFPIPEEVRTLLNCLLVRQRLMYRQRCLNTKPECWQGRCRGDHVPEWERVLCYISQWSYYFCCAMSSLIVWRLTSRRVCNLPFDGLICRLVWSVTAAMLPGLLRLTVLFIFIRFIKSGSLLEKGILWVGICLAVKI